jgi:hypothetical protein
MKSNNISLQYHLKQPQPDPLKISWDRNIWNQIQGRKIDEPFISYPTERPRHITLAKREPDSIYQSVKIHRPPVQKEQQRGRKLVRKVAVITQVTAP